MTEAESLKRSETQFQTIHINIVAAAALAAMAFGDQGRPQALLVVPVLSFALFAHWVHLGLTIRLAHSQPPAPIDPWRGLALITHAISILFAFVGVPIIALLAYPGPSGDIIEQLGYVLSASSMLLYGLWFYVQYFRRPHRST